MLRVDRHGSGWIGSSVVAAFCYQDVTKGSAGRSRAHLTLPRLIHGFVTNATLQVPLQRVYLSIEGETKITALVVKHVDEAGVRRSDSVVRLGPLRAGQELQPPVFLLKANHHPRDRRVQLKRRDEGKSKIASLH